MDTIVLAYDDTEPARLALLRAAELSRAFSAQLVVTTVASLGEALGPGQSAADVETVPAENIEALVRARELLEEIGINATYQAAIGDDPADSIVDVAERSDADLIVVGTRDPGTIQRFLGYSVSQAVLRRARCNVLVVRR